MHHPHDLVYKLLFSEPLTVRHLLTGFITEDWVKRLDLDSLEKVSGTFVSDDLRDRETDVIWRVRFDEEWIYLYLILEFQSTIDPFMALRIMTYVGLMYQDLVKQQKLTREDRLPPVLPVVLYNGDTRWNAACNVAELTQPVPDGLEQYRPSLHYLLLDEGAIVANQQWPKEARNVVAAIFRLEHHQDPQEVIDTIGLLVESLQEPEQIRLRQHFALWIKRILLPRWVPESEEVEWSSLNDLNEVHNMFAERAKKWPEQWKQQGLEEGRKQGLEEGRQEGRQEGEEHRALEIARNMLERTPMDDSMIANLAGLDVEQVRRLREELKH